MIKESLTVLRLNYAGKRDKTVRVYVPAHEEGETFPVIYMTDGQNLFEFEEGMFGCWYTREAIEAERAVSGKAAIIVGIHNDDGAAERANELTPAEIGDLILPDEIRHLAAPEGEVFYDFVVNTVMPAVEARFPVKTGRENTAFCGSSSGGLMAFCIALSHPELFCASGVFSPAFMVYAPQDFSAWILAKTGQQTPYLYFYSGGGDDLENAIRQCTESVYDFMLECYPPEKMNAVILPENPHNETAWAEIFKDFLHTFLARREEF